MTRFFRLILGFIVGLSYWSCAPFSETVTIERSELAQVPVTQRRSHFSGVSLSDGGGPTAIRNSSESSFKLQSSTLQFKGGTKTSSGGTFILKVGPHSELE